MKNESLHADYLSTLLLYYEEEIMGEAYFYALAKCHDSTDIRDKLELLARVERHAANSVEPLLEKYRLTPRTPATLRDLGLSHTTRHEHYSWPEFVNFMVRRYPLYMHDFDRLEQLGPGEDQPCLKALSAHEVAAIEFANREAVGDANSCEALTNYLATKHPVLNEQERLNG